MELREYADTLRKNWVLVVVMTILGMGAGAGLSLLTTPEYWGRTQIYLSVRSDAGEAWELLQGADYSSQVLSSYVDVVSSRAVLDPVVEQLQLDMTGTELAEYVHASSPEESALINILVTSSSAEQSAEIASAVGESFKEVVRARLEPASETDTSLVTLTTTQEALVPASPEGPSIASNLTLGFVLGLAAGYGIALLRRVMDTRVRSVRELEEITEIPVIGGIVNDPDLEKKRLTVHSKAQSPQAKSYRALHTSLQLLNVDPKNRSFVITSANRGEGKSTTALNLAFVLSQAGSRVIVVDSDLRSPMLAEYLGIEGGAGLTDVLIGRSDLEDVVQRWGETESYVLPAGRIPPNPSELLGSDEMKTILETLQEQYDYVILDAPPALSVTDAAVLGRLASSTLLVVAAGLTTRQELESALHGLETAENDLLGIVMTRLPVRGSGRYHYSYTAPFEKADARRRQELKDAHAR